MVKNDNGENDDVTLDVEAQDVPEMSLEEEGESAAAKLKKLRDELKKCQKEKEEYLAGWQRAKADFINARREEEKARADFKKFANKELLMEILSVADSFDMAFANKESWEKVDKNWRVGVEYIYSQLLTTLEQHNLKVLDPIGEKFDPNIHTSIESVPVENKEDDHRIVAVLQKGYTLEGSLIRSPKVKVGEWRE